MVNTLIAIAGNTYDRVDDEIDRLNILENTEMIIESIDYDILGNFVFDVLFLGTAMFIIFPTQFTDLL